MSVKDTVNHFDKQQAESYDARWQALAPFNESLLTEAGFEKPTLFAQSLLIRSWFARAR